MGSPSGSLVDPAAPQVGREQELRRRALLELSFSENGGAKSRALERKAVVGAVDLRDNDGVIIDAPGIYAG